jgi:hypothetical protein
MDGISEHVTEDLGTSTLASTGTKAGEPGKTTDKGGKGKDGGEDFAATVRELRNELKATKEQVGELRNSEQVWFDRYEKLARGGKPELAAGDEPDDDDSEVVDDTPDKLVDEFSAKGVEALVKRGVLTKKAAKELIRKEAEKIARQVAGEVVGRAEGRAVRDSQLFGEFPELRDTKSELYTRTAEVYRQMVKDDPDARNSDRALARAAKEAKLMLRIEQLEKGGDRRGDDVDRGRRIDAQAGDRGRSGGEFRDDKLGPEEREVLKAFERFGTTEEDFLKERDKVRAGRRAR